MLWDDLDFGVALDVEAGLEARLETVLEDGS